MKFLFLYRNSADPSAQPSASEMQAGYAQWKAWMTKYSKEIDPERVSGVLHMLYLLFNEGYSSAQPDRVIRRELCDEALRLALVLEEDPAGAIAETDALVALMCLHAARFDARVDGMGGLLLLEEQDRSSWDRELIQRGLDHLARSARGETFSR
jgi:RNA polymerase sigma-70 factor (ECF subfamily)